VGIAIALAVAVPSSGSSADAGGDATAAGQPPDESYGCVREQRKPHVSQRRPRVRRRSIRTRGEATDRGCAGVRRVYVTIARHRRGRCRFIRANGRYTRPRPCTRPVRIDANGIDPWQRRVRVRRMRPGRYVVVARAVDRDGNRSNRARRAFRVR
jgi:hypothetical protein